MLPDINTSHFGYDFHLEQIVNNTADTDHIHQAVNRLPPLRGHSAHHRPEGDYTQKNEYEKHPKSDDDGGVFKSLMDNLTHLEKIIDPDIDHKVHTDRE